MTGKLARLAIPAIVVELLIGFLLGNSVLPYEAIAPLSGLTELGVLALFFQVGLEVRGDLLASRRATVLRLVGLSLIGPLLGYWPLVHGLGMAPAAAVLCLACTAATGTGVTLRLLAQRQAIHTPSGRLLVAVSAPWPGPAAGFAGGRPQRPPRSLVAAAGQTSPQQPPGGVDPVGGQRLGR